MAASCRGRKEDWFALKGTSVASECSFRKQSRVAAALPYPTNQDTGPSKLSAQVWA